MLRQIFYGLLGAYFVAGLLVGLNWAGVIDLDKSSKPTPIQEDGFAAAEAKGTPGAESADVRDVIVTEALTSGGNGNHNRNGFASPATVAVPQLPPIDQRTASRPGRNTDELGRDRNGFASPATVAVPQLPPIDHRTASPTGGDAGELGRRRPQPPQRLEPAEANRASLPTNRAKNPASIPQQPTDGRKSTSMLPPAQVDTGVAPTVTALSRAQQDRRLLNAPRNQIELDTGDHGGVAEVTTISRPQQGRHLLEASRKPVELVSVSPQLNTGAPPKVKALSRAQPGGRLLAASRKPVELTTVSGSGPSFGGTPEPSPMGLGIENHRKDPANPDSKVFTLACPLLLPTIAAGKLSEDKGKEISRMQENYVKKAECLQAAKRASTVAKRRIGCHCTAVMK